MKTHEMLEEENDRMVEQMASKVAALKSVSYFQESAPPRKFLHLDNMRVLLRPSETTITTQIFGNWTVTQAIHHMVVSRSPFPSESAFVYEALPQNCLLELQI